MPITWLWIPITLAAAAAQTARNATQRHLTRDLGTLGATLVRFLYGLPFAVVYLGGVLGVTGAAVPPMNLGFVFWALVGGSSQIIATALLLRVLALRNFAIGVAYSKTEVIQVAIFGFVILAETIGLVVGISIVLAAAGVMLLATPGQTGLVKGLTSKAALLGIASGGVFAISAIGYRAAALALAPDAPIIAAACTLVFAQFTQTLMLGGYLLAREPKVVAAVARAWRVSLLAGFMGALGSGCWVTAMALEPVAHVRTLGLVEL
ncbi:MAG: EamA/RhaT family transporter, partial [Proteobacteria bacterium]|nr:EamA/RhaT family transporter [Pseudomonadota bacterium]